MAKERMITVRETEPAKSVGVFAIMDKKGELAVTVNVWYKSQASVRVSFFDHHIGEWITKEANDIVAACRGLTLCGIALCGYGHRDSHTAKVQAMPVVTAGDFEKRRKVLVSQGMTADSGEVQYVAGLQRMEAFGYRLYHLL